MAPLIYEIPKKSRMLVPGRIIANKEIFSTLSNDKTFRQIEHVAHLPGILDAAIALPDAHQGYGFPIGGVAAFSLKKGIVSPGGVGYDINCGVRLLRTTVSLKDFRPHQEKVADLLHRAIPSGLGRGGDFPLSDKLLKDILTKGSPALIAQGYGEKNDARYCEEEGCMPGAKMENVPEKAIRRGRGQLGTLGSGNHFVEVLYVEKIFDSTAANAYGLKKNQIVVLIHCGSRGIGHQTASEYIHKMEAAYGYEHLPSRELACAPLTSNLAKDYLSAMAACANFGFANKQLMTHRIREIFAKEFSGAKTSMVYEVCHNIAKMEVHTVGGERQKVCVHRKGATRSFGKRRPEIPTPYRSVGQPVLIPGSMGTSSYVMKGLCGYSSPTFGSSVHGAGRVKSRTAAHDLFSAQDIKKDLARQQISLRAGSDRSLTEEAPGVYKDVDEVVSIVDTLGISGKVARLKPVVVIIG